MENALKFIATMRKEGVLKEYAIGGAIATIYIRNLLPPMMWTFFYTA